MAFTYVLGSTAEKLLRHHRLDRRFGAVRTFLCDLGQRSVECRTEGLVHLGDIRAVSTQQWRTVKVYLKLLVTWGLLRKASHNAVHCYELVGFSDCNRSAIDREQTRDMWREAAHQRREEERSAQVLETQSAAKTGTCEPKTPLATVSSSKVSSTYVRTGTEKRSDSAPEAAVVHASPSAGEAETETADEIRAMLAVWEARGPAPKRDDAVEDDDLLCDDDDAPSLEPVPDPDPDPEVTAPAPVGTPSRDIPMRFKPMGRQVNEGSVAKALVRLQVPPGDQAKTQELFQLLAGQDEGFLGRVVWGVERAMKRREVRDPYAYAKATFTRQLQFLS